MFVVLSKKVHSLAELNTVDLYYLDGRNMYIRFCSAISYVSCVGQFLV